MKHTLAAILMLSAAFAFGQEKDMAFYYNKGKEAYRAKNYPEFYSMIKEANKIHPYHQGVLYQLGIASALTGRKDEAILNLKKAILIDAGFRLEGVADLDAIKGSPEFQSLLALQQEWQRPVMHSDTAFVIKDRSLHTEGIEVAPSTNTFYLGSIHRRKIIKVTASGAMTDFCKEGVQGMTSVFGIKVDEKRNVLWACSSPMPEMENFDSTATSAVFKFELSSGRLLEKYERPQWDGGGVFGDLVINKKGEVFVSDSKSNTIYLLRENTRTLEPFFNWDDWRNIQGLAFSPDERYLFVSDYITGLFRIDMKKKVIAQIKCSLDVSLKGIDGLLAVDHALIAIHNGTNPLRVIRYSLNSAQDQIVQFDVIDRKHPAFNEPTMGVISGKKLYYIANSQWSGYNDQHQIKPNEELQDIVVLTFRFQR